MVYNAGLRDRQMEGVCMAAAIRMTSTRGKVGRERESGKTEEQEGTNAHTKDPERKADSEASNCWLVGWLSFG